MEPRDSATDSQPTLPPTGEGIALKYFLDAFMHPRADKWEHALAMVGIIAILRCVTVISEGAKELCCDVLKQRQRVAALDAGEEAAMALLNRRQEEEQRILRPLYEELSEADKQVVEKDLAYWLVRRWGYTVRSAIAWICLRTFLAHLLPIAIALYIIWAVPSASNWDMAARIYTGLHYGVYAAGVTVGIMWAPIAWRCFGHQPPIRALVQCLLIPSPIGVQALRRVDMLWNGAVEFEKAPLRHLVKLLFGLLVLPERIALFFFWKMLFDGCIPRGRQGAFGLFLAFLIMAEPFISASLWGWRVYVAPDFWPFVGLLTAAHGCVGAASFRFMIWNPPKLL